MGYVEELRAIIGHRPVILVGVNVIIVDRQKRILLQQRTEPYGVWGLPGGLMELEESTEETAHREVFEETGLSIGKLELFDVFSGHHLKHLKAANGDVFNCIAIVYTTTDATGEPRVNDNESLKLQYFHLDELPSNMARSQAPILEKYVDSQMEG